MVNKQITINIEPAFEGLYRPCSYKVYYGGRGGGKSHAMALALLVKGMEKSINILCCREVQSSMGESVLALLKNKIDDYGFEGWEFKNNILSHINGTKIYFKGLLRNTDSLKSMEDIAICWIEEAHNISQDSLTKLIPTITRVKDSEIWVSFNPDSDEDPVYKQFVSNTSTLYRENSYIQQVNYTDNKYIEDSFVKVAEDMQRDDPNGYNHIYLGVPYSGSSGSYYGDRLLDVFFNDTVLDNSYPVYISWDLGINDKTVLWYSQIINGRYHIVKVKAYSNLGLEEICSDINLYIKTNSIYVESNILPHDSNHRKLSSTIDTPKDIIERFMRVPSLVLGCTSISDGIRQVRSKLGLCTFYRGTEEGLLALRKYRQATNKAGEFTGSPLHDTNGYSDYADSFRYLCVGLDSAEKKRRSTAEYNRLYN